MNRDIKFRVWDNKKMYYDGQGDEVSIFRIINGKTYVIRVGGIFNGNTPVWVDNKDYVCMQYVGMRDKNGKEIYEGDIVIHPVNGNRTDESDAIYLVEFRGSAFMIVNRDTKSRYRIYSSHRIHDFDETIEVVGNIYENPELIKKHGRSNNENEGAI